MNAFYREFLREDPRQYAGGQERQVFLAAFGKHPGWDDHMEDIGLATPALIEAKKLIYLQGISGQIDAGAWEPAALGHPPCAFDHLFLWLRGTQCLIGRMWASSDAKGRTRYPLVVCAHVFGLPVAQAVGLVAPALERVGERLRACRSSGEVRSHLARTLAELRDGLTRGATPTVRMSREQFLADPAMGLEHEGLLRVTQEASTKLAAYLEEGVTQSRMATALRAQHVRVPATQAAPTEVLLAWQRFFAIQISPDVPVLYLLACGRSWLDVIVGEPTTKEFYCLGAPAEAAPPASAIPFQLGPEAIERGRRWMQRFQNAESRVPGEPTPSAARQAAAPSPLRQWPKFAIFGSMALLCIGVGVYMLRPPSKPSGPPSTPPAQTQRPPVAVTPTPPPKPLTPTLTPPVAQTAPAPTVTQAAPPVVTPPPPPPNRPPALTELPSRLDLQVGQTAPSTSAFSVTDEAPDQVRFELSGGGTNLAEARVQGAGGARDLVLQPRQPGEATLTLVATDAAGLRTNYSIGLTVKAANRPPALAGLPARLDLQVGQPAPSTNAFSITDETPDQVRVGISGAGTNLAEARVQGAGRTRDLVLQPKQAGQASLTIVAVDPASLLTNYVIALTVKPVNRPPGLAELPSRLSLQEGQATSSTNAFVITDEAPAQVKVQATCAPPEQAEVSVQGTGPNRLLVVRPRQPGEARVTVEATDPAGLRTNAVVALTIAPKPVAGSIFTNSFGMVFRRIEGLTNFGRKPVYVGVYEVTRGEYARVTRKGTNTSDRLPVTEVSGNAALDFCQSLNQADKLILPGHHYGLPNVEQWLEFAGDTSDWTNAVISQPGPAVVGSKGTNRYGLYDVLGNVFEWCRQGADTVAYGGSYDDQFGPRVLRLGLFSSAGGAPDIGFRCVLAPE